MWSGATRRLPHRLAFALAVACGAAALVLPAAPAEDARKVVVCLGDSLTAGYGLSAEEAWPALIQARVDARGLAFRVVNAGVSGDTSAGALRRVDWLLRLPVAVLVVAIGGNDLLRGQDPAALRRNLEAIVARTRRVHPEARFVIAGMRAPPNLGSVYTSAFEAVYPEVAEGADAALVPFLLAGVAGDAELNQLDGIHPTAEGQRIIAETVWQALEPLLPAPH
jgi:acyl-CoA thioesterase-1